MSGRALRILVTGAAGLIGAELCAALAGRGHAVLALVHRNRSFRTIAGGLEPSAHPGGEPHAGMVAWIAGDTRAAGLGLAEGALAGPLDLVIHCAARTDFAGPAALYRAVNVEGTRNVLALAGETGAGFLHVSTAYTCGEYSGPVSEALHAGATFGNGYEASKAEAEALVAGANLPFAIARPSIVVGRASDGAIGRFENIYGFLKLIGSGRIGTLPVTPGASLDLVPIDHVTAALVDIAEAFEAANGRFFHLVSGEATPVATLVSIDYPGFHVPRVVAPEAFDPSALDPAEAFLHGAVTSHFASYLRRDPRFRADNLFALSGRRCPPTGPGFLRRLVDQAVRAGYLVPDAALLAKASAGPGLSGSKS